MCLGFNLPMSLDQLGRGVNEWMDGKVKVRPLVATFGADEQF